eukprot:339677_1
MFCFCKSQLELQELDSSSTSSFETSPKRVVKMVLLGTSMSGKTTITKQLKQVYDSPMDCDAYSNTTTPFIRDRIIINMQKLCTESLLLHNNKSPFGISHIPYIAAIRDEILSLQRAPSSHALTSDIAVKMTQLWNDDAIKAAYQQRHSRFRIDMNLEYFMNKIHDIARDDYVADLEDYMRLDIRSTGFSTTKLMKSVDNYGSYSFEVLDVGGTRSERKKWWKHNLLFNGIDLDAFVYTVAVSDYDLAIFEDDQTNYLMESIRVWKETMIKSDFFADKAVFIVLNKYDLFVDKIKNTAITCCFDDYPDEMDPNDPDQVIRFITGKFVDVLDEHDITFKGPLRIFRTTATDTASVENAFNQIM